MKHDFDLNRTRLLAHDLREKYFADVRPLEDDAGQTPEHMAWMLDYVVIDCDMTLSKASRWVGYVQAWLVIHFKAKLETIKDETRYWRDYARHE